LRFVGTAEVHVETGNQTTGYLSRPLMLAASSDESIRLVAQGICDNLKAGSNAKIAFVGKVPNPGPAGPDWGRYRYDCESTVAPMPPAHVAVVAAGAPASTAPASVPSATAPPTAPATAAPAAAAPSAVGDEQHFRPCVLLRRAHHRCLGNCMIDSTSPPQAVAAECRQRCASKEPVGCP
jgi:hypothetical protein